MSDRSLGRTLWNLVLALLNATLILVALCLGLAWAVSNNIKSVTAEFAQNLIDVAPLRDEVGDLRIEVAGLRDDIAVLTTQGDALTDAALTRLSERAETIDARLDDINARVGTVMQDPGVLIDRAVERTVVAVADQVGGLAQCTATDPDGTSG